MKASGFSLIEVLIATAIVVSAAAGLGRLFVASADATRVAGGTATALLLAEQKLEELHAADGPLTASPAGALTTDTGGFVDYWDLSGAPAITSSPGAAPAGSVFVRRWSIEPARSGSIAPVVLQVVVIPRNVSWLAGRSPTRLVSVRTE
jgi:prepilin-type N-terminal cleavage/methylation domain-containing protein